MGGVIERLIVCLERDPAYRFEAVYGSRGLAAILWHRGCQAWRGVWLRPWLRAGAFPIFRGRRVVVEHAYRGSCGSALILEDGVFINAPSQRGMTFGRNVTIGKRTIIQCTGVVARQGVGLEMGDNSAVGALSFVGAQGGIRIGSNVIMGLGVRIFSENHRYGDPQVPIRLQGETRESVQIHDDCWIGASTTILAGVTIGRGSVIAAGAVVTRDVPPGVVMAGVPARPIGKRS